MKKIFLLILCVGLITPARAQGIVRGMFRALRAPGVSAELKALQGARPISMEYTSKVTTGFGISMPEQIAREATREQLAQAQWQTALHASFRAIPEKSTFDNVFSGTVFQTTYRGQQEVFAVIPTHALTTQPRTILQTMTANASLMRDFTIEAYDEAGNAVSVPAQVVQLGAWGTVDVSLVKLRARDLHLFRPLSINPQVSVGETLLSQGFADEYTVFIPHRQVVEITPFSLRTTMGGPRSLRRGLCGSALLNETGELVGIHTGSTSDKLADESDTGYATPAYYLNKLVEAYHNRGEAFIPFELDGHKILDLRIDEYISRWVLRGEDGKVLRDSFSSKRFPYQHMLYWVNRLAPRYIELTVGRMKWNEQNGQYVDLEHEVRRIRYDVLRHESKEIEITYPFSPIVP